MDGVWSSVYKEKQLIDIIDTEWCTHELPSDDIILPPSISTVTAEEQPTPLNPTNVSYAVLNNIKLNNNVNDNNKWSELGLSEFLNEKPYTTSHSNNTSNTNTNH